MSVQSSTVVAPTRRIAVDNRQPALPRSGNVALAAAACIQAVLGVEFLLNGLNKLSDPNYTINFAWVALAAAGGAVGMTALSFTIFMIQGGVLPAIDPARAFSSAIPVELLLVPLGLAIAWLQGDSRHGSALNRCGCHSSGGGQVPGRPKAHGTFRWCQSKGLFAADPVVDRRSSGRTSRQPRLPAQGPWAIGVGAC